MEDGTVISLGFEQLTAIAAKAAARIKLNSFFIMTIIKKKPARHSPTGFSVIFYLTVMLNFFSLLISDVPP